MHRYPGLHDARNTFSRLIGFHARVADLCQRFAPGTPDRAMMQGVLDALTAAAAHFTGEADFYRRQGHSTPGKRPIGHRGALERSEKNA